MTSNPVQSGSKKEATGAGAQANMTEAEASESAEQEAKPYACKEQPHMQFLVEWKRKFLAITSLPTAHWKHLLDKMD